MAFIIDHSSVNITSANTSREAAIPDTSQRMKVIIARGTAQNPNFIPDVDLRVRVDIELDLGDGNGFVPFSGFTAPGGILPRRDGGGDIPESWIMYNLPGGAGRQVRLTLARLQGAGAVITEVSAEVFDEA